MDEGGDGQTGDEWGLPVWRSVGTEGPQQPTGPRAGAWRELFGQTPTVWPCGEIKAQQEHRPEVTPQPGRSPGEVRKTFVFQSMVSGDIRPLVGPRASRPQGPGAPQRTSQPCWPLALFPQGATLKPEMTPVRDPVGVAQVASGGRASWMSQCSLDRPMNAQISSGGMLSLPGH